MEGRNIGIFAGARQNLHIGLGFIFADIIKGCLAAGTGISRHPRFFAVFDC